MLRLILTIGLVVAFGASSASADVFVTEQADWNSSLFGTGGPATLAPNKFFDGSGGAGVSYVNQLAGATAGGNNPFIAVGAVKLNDLNLVGGGTFGPPTHGGAGSQSTIAIFAVSGLVNDGPAGSVVVDFQSGRITFGLSSTYNQNNPSTWGFSNAPTAAYQLKPSEDVVPGAGFVINLDGSDFPGDPNDLVNKIFTTIALQQTFTGNFLFKETNVGAGLITTSTGAPGFDAEGFLAIIGETLDNGFQPLNQDLTVLNQITNAAGLGNFATGYGGALATDYTPNVTNGDFSTTLTLNNFIPGREYSNNEVPEPASMLVWGVGMGIAGLMGARRRRNKANA